MSNISAQDVKKLRDMTGSGMMDCKKALTEANGDIEGAIEILRKKGQKMSAKRADREANEGVVVALTSPDNKKGVVVRLSCETDFVSKGESFVDFGKKIASIALDKMPDSAEALLAESFDGDLTIGKKIEEQIGVIGEKLEVSQYAKLETAGQIQPYIHMGYKAGVIVALNQEGDFEEAGKNIAMQIAAMHPVAVDKDGVDADTIAKEIEIGKEQARQEGKPEAILEKIAMGKLNKFYKESTLLQQSYVKDGKMSVGEYLKSVHADLTVDDFKHVKLG